MLILEEIGLLGSLGGLIFKEKKKKLIMLKLTFIFHPKTLSAHNFSTFQ